MEHGSELSAVVIVSVVLIAGAVTRRISRSFRFPYTIAMLVVGFAVGIAFRYIPVLHEGSLIAMLRQGAGLSPHLIIFVFLPALVFESSFGLESYAFRKNLWQICFLAGPALVACTFATAAVVRGLTSLDAFPWQWSWIAALLFGALVSATDPVAVVGLLRESGAPKRLGVIVEGESLLNDGTSIVVFSVFLALLTGSAAGLNPGMIGFDFVRVVAGGIVVGLVLAIAISQWLARTFNDPLVEITLTVVLAYASMVVAEAFLHVSGIMAVVTAGLWMSARGKTRISPEVSHFLHQFWEMLAYIANTLIFYLVGLVIATQVHAARTSDFLLIIATWAAVLAIRFAVLFASRPALNAGGDRIGAAETMVVGWGGLRGAVSLALALVVSQHPAIDSLVGRQVLLLTAGVVLLTILVNGSTMAWLLRRTGLGQIPTIERAAQLHAEVAALREVESKVDTVRGSSDLRAVRWGDVENDLRERRERSERALACAQQELALASASEKAGHDWRQVLEIERQAYWTAFGNGTLGATAVQILDHEIETQIDRVVHGNLEPPPGRILERRNFGRWIAERVTGRRHGIVTRFQFARLSLLYDLARAVVQSSEAVMRAIDRIEGFDPHEGVRIRETYARYRLAGKELLEDLRANLPEITQAIETRLARRIGLNFEREAYDRFWRTGLLDHDAASSARQRVEKRIKKLWFEATRVDLPDFRELVRETPLFTQLDAAALDRVAELAEERIVAPGDYLFRENDHGDSMYVIARGSVQVLKKVDGGQEVLDVLGRGEILGEMALLTGERRNASIRAATAVTVGRVDKRDFDQLLRDHPRLRERIWSAFAEREFDTFAGHLPAFRSLTHEERLRWIRNSRVEEVRASQVEFSDASHIFVVTGKVASDGAVAKAPAIVDLRGVKNVTVPDSARLVILRRLES